MTSSPTGLPDRVLVTGAAGFIGRALVARLRENGCRVVGVDSAPDPDPQIVAGSTVDPSSWAHLLDGVGAVVHTAAIVSNAASHAEAWRVNVLGTRRVIEAMSRAGVPRLLHVSSIMAFGFDFPDGVDESYPARVTGYSYPDTRVNSEAVALAAQVRGDTDVTIVRPGDVIGPRSVWVVEPLRLAPRGLLLLPANGTGLLSPIYLDNLLDGMLLALTEPRASGEVITLTDGYLIPCRDYFGRLAALAGARAHTLPSPAAVGLIHSAGAVLRRLGRDSELSAASALMLSRTGGYSTAKARRLLGYTPQVGYEDAMTRIEAWVRAEGLV
jgi:nucleoside-diphosphate-sugar epimerase